MVWNSSRPPASNHAMWNMHNWDSVTTDAYHLTVVARTAAFCHNDDLYRCLDGRNWKRYAANMPCVCGNGRIIRCAEGNRVSRDVQKTILHPVLIGIVCEHVEAFTGGPHVHACQSHSTPRLIRESPFVDPPAVDGRQTIDDASADCEFRVGGQFREMNRGYGKLLLRVEDVDSHGDAIAQRRAAGVPCDKLKSFCRMTVRNHRDVVERRHFVFSVVHQLQFDGV